MSRRQASVLAVTGALALLFGGSSVSGQEARWIAFSRVMAELSHNREFVEMVHQRLGRDPRAGGILGPEQIKKLRLGPRRERICRLPEPLAMGRGYRRGIRGGHVLGWLSKTEAHSRRAVALLDVITACRPSTDTSEQRAWF